LAFGVVTERVSTPLAVKIWQASSQEPVKVSSEARWFLQEVSKAVQFYALDLGVERIRLNVRDTNGGLHVFDVELRRTIEAVLHPLPMPVSS
jgi:hypothetical protein